MAPWFPFVTGSLVTFSVITHASELQIEQIKKYRIDVNQSQI